MKKIDLLKSQLTFLTLHGGDVKEITELEKKIAMSKQGSKSKRKGASYENVVKKIISDKFPNLELVRTPASGGFQKASTNTALRGDVSNVNELFNFMLHLEAKNQKTWKLKDWLSQAREDCPEGKVSSVVFHQEQKNENGKRIQEADDFICMRLTDFLEIVDESKLIIEAGKLKVEKKVKKKVLKK